MESIRSMYERHGVSGYYALHRDSYVNPHGRDVESLLLNAIDVSNFKHGIDFSCGDGLVSRTLSGIKWVGVDPYMGERYTALTGNECIRSSMEDVTRGVVALPRVDVIVCSYCFDIFEKSYMEMFLWRLSQCSDVLVVIRGNKKVVGSKWWDVSYAKNKGRSNAVVYKVKRHTW